MKSLFIVYTFSLSSKQKLCCASVADSRDTWGIDSLASGVNWWERGTMAINADGTWTAAVTENDGTPRAWNGNISISPSSLFLASAEKCRRCGTVLTRAPF